MVNINQAGHGGARGTLLRRTPPPSLGGEHPRVRYAFPYRILCTYRVGGRVVGVDNTGAKVRRLLLDAR